MTKSGYDIKAGDKFVYGGISYRATADATGEFNAYVRCYNDRLGADTEIIIRHGASVEIIE